MGRCSKCKEEKDSLDSLTEYGNNRLGNIDSNEYCGECFVTKYPHLHDRTQDEESD